MTAADAGQALVVVIALAVVCVVVAKAINRRYARTEAELLAEWKRTHRSRLSIVPSSTDYIDDADPEYDALAPVRNASSSK